MANGQAWWEWFEHEVLDSYGEGASFKTVEAAAALGISPDDAKTGLYAYEGAQRSQRSMTKYTLRRTGRTRGAVWHVGSSADDVRGVMGQMCDDTRSRLMDAIRPDIGRMAAINPRSAQRAAQSVESLVDGLVTTVSAIMASVGFDES